METKNIKIKESPNDKDKIRIEAEISYDNKDILPELYWADLPKDYERFISDSGNPWLVGLIPLAVTIGEPLRISKPVDKMLFKNIKKLMHIWKSWYPNLHLIQIEADIKDKIENGKFNKTAAFFSGGIDSFFTVLRQDVDLELEERFNIDDLINVWGFDIPINNFESFHKQIESLRKAAEGLKKNLIDISTNLTETHWKRTAWGKLSHGCALGFITLILENKYSRVLIPSTGGYVDPHPWGSNILTDPLLSTSSMEVIHDGSMFNRLEKTKLVANSRIAMSSLHVCWVLGSHLNCSNCSKCFRTMVPLDLLGVLNDFKTFNAEHYSVKKIRNIYYKNYYDREYFKQIRDLAVEKKRVDVISAIDQSFMRSDKLDKYVRLAKKFRRLLSTKRFVWRWADTLEKIVLRDSLL